MERESVMHALCPADTHRVWILICESQLNHSLFLHTLKGPTPPTFYTSTRKYKYLYTITCGLIHARYTSICRYTHTWGYTQAGKDIRRFHTRGINIHTHLSSYIKCYVHTYKRTHTYVRAQTAHAQ